MLSERRRLSPPSADKPRPARDSQSLGRCQPHSLPAISDTHVHERPGSEQASQKFRRTPGCTMHCPNWNLPAVGGRHMRATPFQAPESARGGHVARVQATHEPNTTENKIWLASRTAARARPPAYALILALGVRIVVVALNTVQPAKGAKHRAGEECPRMQSRRGPRSALRPALMR